jgi:hypothetical protein
MSITLPEDILARARKQAEAAGFGDDIAAYVESLIEEIDEQGEAQPWIAVRVADVDGL